MMKRILIYIPILFILVWACNPMEDIYDELDANQEPYKENIVYSLTDADYTTVRYEALKNSLNSSDSNMAYAISSDKAFNQVFTARDYMYPVLDKLYPALKLNSEAIVTFTTTEKPHTLAKYEDNNVVLTQEDYESVISYFAEEGFFYGGFTFDKSATELLSTYYPEAEIDEVAYVTYNQYIHEGNPWQNDKDTTPLIVHNFEESNYADYDSIDKDGWTQAILKGTKGWQAREHDENFYAQFSSYSSDEENELYLISPAFDLTQSTVNLLTFDINVGYWTHAGLEIFVTSDTTGGVNSGNWTDITSNFTIPEEPTSGYGEFQNAGVYNLESFSDVLYVAFKYTGDGANSLTTTYQIDDVTLLGLGYASKEISEFYMFDGTDWNLNTNYWMLSAAEYAECGSAGANNYFSTYNDPAYYIPSLLEQKYGITSQDSTVLVIYNYNDGSTFRVADEYIYDGTAWTSVSTAGKIVQDLQYKHNGTMWKFNPEVSFTMTSADYQMITDYVLAENPSYGYDDGSREFYYGSASKYSNFDLRVSKRPEFDIPTGIDGTTWDDLSTEEAIDLIWSRVPEAVGILLKLKFPDAVTQVGGIDVHYKVTFYTFENDLASDFYTVDMQCTKNGPDPEFTQVGDIVKVK